MLSNDNECQKTDEEDFPESIPYQFSLVLYRYKNKNLSLLNPFHQFFTTPWTQKFNGRELDFQIEHLIYLAAVLQFLLIGGN